MFDIKKFKFDSLLSNCYVLKNLDKNAVIVIDPFISDELFRYIEKLNSDKILVLLTHEHFDHTTGVNDVKRRFQATLICSKACANRIAQKRNNRPLSIMGNITIIEKYKNLPLYECFADIIFDCNFVYDWYGTKLKFTLTPGHSIGSICVEIGDYVFVGDSALLNEQTVTRFPTGNQSDYDDITVPFLFGLGKNKTIMPGHGESYKLMEVIWKEGCFQKQ